MPGGSVTGHPITVQNQVLIDLFATHVLHCPLVYGINAKSKVSRS